MTTAATIAAKLTLDASDFEGNLQGATRAADGFESKMKSVGQTMQKVGAAMTLALTVPIVAFMKASVESAAQSEAALADLNGQWIDRFHDRNGLKYIVLDMDSSVSPTHGDQEGAAWNGHFDCTCYHPNFLFNQFVLSLKSHVCLHQTLQPQYKP